MKASTGKIGIVFTYKQGKYSNRPLFVNSLYDLDINFTCICLIFGVREAEFRTSYHFSISVGNDIAIRFRSSLGAEGA